MDTLEFRLMSPWDAGENWTRELEAEEDIGAEIWLNGEELCAVLKWEEQAADPNIAGAYGHMSPRVLLSELRQAQRTGTPEAERGAYLLWCGDCGDPGCWSARAHVRADGNTVFWRVSGSLPPEVQLDYRFDAGEYEDTLRTLARLSGPERH